MRVCVDTAPAAPSVPPLVPAMGGELARGCLAQRWGCSPSVESSKSSKNSRESWHVPASMPVPGVSAPVPSSARAVAVVVVCGGCGVAVVASPRGVPDEDSCVDLHSPSLGAAPPNVVGAVTVTHEGPPTPH